MVARLLDSTNAAGQSLPHLANISHHVILGFHGVVIPTRLTRNTRGYSLSLTKRGGRARRRDRGGEQQRITVFRQRHQGGEGPWQTATGGLGGWGVAVLESHTWQDLGGNGTSEPRQELQHN